MRSYKEFNLTDYKENIINHNLYISTLYEPDTETISTNIQQIIRDSLEPMAKVMKIKSHLLKIF